MIIYAREPEVTEVARLIQFRIDFDGLMATAGSTLWKGFVQEARLKKNQHIYVLIFKEMSHLVLLRSLVKIAK